MNIKQLVSSGVGIALVFLLSACSSSYPPIGYYGQSIVGHSRLMLARVPVEKAIETAEPELKRKLMLAQSLRRFAVTDLALPDNKSYQSYVALDRDFPVWTVVAAGEFSLEAKSWCYFIVGCASYRGYFSEGAALKFADQLAQQGYETTVGGAGAYSTLGWFADPLLPSMMRYGDALFAETLFHELAHQILYFKGDSSFNEAFATVVGEYGAQHWLQNHRPEQESEYLEQLQAGKQFEQLLARSKEELLSLYATDLDEDAMRRAKTDIFEQLKIRYTQLRDRHWGGRGWYDGWFETPLNNARLAAFATYRDRVPEIKRLLENCNFQLARFYQSLSDNRDSETVVVPNHCN